MKTAKLKPQQTKAVIGILAIFACLLALPLISGCAGARSGMALPADASIPYNTNLLNAGDLIQIVFPGATNLNTIARVPVDGTVTLPFAGSFTAAGKSPKDLQDDILKSYGSQLQIKEVNVVIVESAATVNVTGAVLRPGTVRLTKPLTVLDAVTECGGFDNTRARPGKVRVIRVIEGKQQVYEVDLKKALSGRETLPFYLRPSDVIFVPFKTFNL